MRFKKFFFQFFKFRIQFFNSFSGISFFQRFSIFAIAFSATILFIIIHFILPSQHQIEIILLHFSFLQKNTLL